MKFLTTIISTSVATATAAILMGAAANSAFDESRAGTFCPAEGVCREHAKHVSPFAVRAGSWEGAASYQLYRFERSLMAPMGLTPF